MEGLNGRKCVAWVCRLYLGGRVRFSWRRRSRLAREISGTAPRRAQKYNIDFTRQGVVGYREVRAGEGYVVGEDKFYPVCDAVDLCIMSGKCESRRGDVEGDYWDRQIGEPEG
jgi:hypothetical protein